jgi:hypothetical protein
MSREARDIGWRQLASTLNDFDWPECVPEWACASMFDISRAFQATFIGFAWCSGSVGPKSW